MFKYLFKLLQTSNFVLKAAKVKNVYKKFAYHPTTCSLKQVGTKIFHETKNNVQCVNYRTILAILLCNLYSSSAKTMFNLEIHVYVLH